MAPWASVGSCRALAHVGSPPIAREHPSPNTSGYAITPQPGELGRYRWHRQWKVANTGVGLPYVISVIVTYNNDTGDAKTTRLDLERRKSW